MSTLQPESRLQQSLDEVTRLLDRHRVLETLTHRQEGPKRDLLESLQHRQNLVELHRRLRAMHPADVAFVLESLPPGAYGFGFPTEGKMTVMDLAGKDLLSVPITNDKDLKRPRPLMMAADASGVRLYNGKNYVVIAAQ